jgi:tubulin gamma
MRWSIKQGLDGVITDDPKLFLEVRRNWHEGMREGFNILMWLDVLRINFLALIFGWLFMMKFGASDTKQLVQLSSRSPSRSRVEEIQE